MKPEESHTPGLICRSVYDARRGGGRAYLRHLCLAVINAATWAAYVKPLGIPLELKIVGVPDERLVDQLNALGVTILSNQKPHELCQYSPTFNKLLSLPGSEADSRTLLVDNDTALLGDISALAHYQSDQVFLSVADRARVDHSMWCELINEMNIPVIKEDWIPWLERFVFARDGGELRVEGNLYFNSGVVLLPRGEAAPFFGMLWNKYSRSLSKFCEEKGYNQRKVLGSDQASLAMAIAEYEQFNHLPVAYHYRPFHFWYGDLEGDQVRVFHAFGSRPAFDSLSRKDKRVPVKFVDAYFDSLVNRNCPVGDSRRVASDIVRDKIKTAITECSCNSIGN